MSDGFAINLEQFTPYVNELRQMPTVMREKLARGAAKAVAGELRDRAVANVPVLAEERAGVAPPGNLKRSIYAVRIPEKCSFTTEVWKVDIRVGKGNWKHKRNQGKATNTQGAYYGVWVEKGHFTRTPASVLKFGPGTRNQNREAWQKSGKATWVAPRPYMAPAILSMNGDFEKIVRSYYDRNMPEALRTFRFLKAAP